MTKWIVALSGALLTTAALAGPSSSGGAMTVTCKNRQGQVISHELLDIYEAKHLYNYELMPSSGSVEQDYINSVTNTYRLQGAQLDHEADSRINLSRFYNLTNIIDRPLPFLGDQGRTLSLPVGCSLRQLAIFDDERNVVDVDRRLWQQLNSLNQSAFITHELYYFFDRKDFGATNSHEARAYVAAIYAKPGAFLSPIPLDRYGNTRFSTRDTEWRVTYRDPKTGATSSEPKDREKSSSFSVDRGFGNQVKLTFQHLMGRAILGYNEAFIEGTDLQLKRQFSQELNSFICLPKKENQSLEAIAPLKGAQVKTWSVGLKYISGQPAEIQLFDDGELIKSAVITSCD